MTIGVPIVTRLHSLPNTQSPHPRPRPLNTQSLKFLTLTTVGEVLLLAAGVFLCLFSSVCFSVSIII